MTAPTRLVDLLDGALCSWAQPARPYARLCGTPNPNHPEITCWRLAGHTGLLHVSETTAWTEEDTPMSQPETLPSPEPATVPPTVWWSATAAREDPEGLQRGLLWKFRGRIHYVPQRALGYHLAELPADAVRLVPASDVGFVLADNERMLAQHTADVAEISRLRHALAQASTPSDSESGARGSDDAEVDQLHAWVVQLGELVDAVRDWRAAR